MKIDRGWVAVFAWLACAGCGSGGLASVQGRVTLDGKPLDGAKIVFQPLAGKRPSSAITDADGNYALLYTADLSGAEIGRHRVDIRCERVVEKKGTEITLPDPVPAKYNNKSTLEKDVAAGRNQIDFELTSK